MMHETSLTQQSVATGGVDSTVDEVLSLTEAGFTIQSTGGTLTADGSEQTLVLVSEPLGIWCPSLLILDLDAMQAGDTIALKIYHRMSDAGSLQLFKYYTWTGADGGLLNSEKLAETCLYPNRHGYQVTLQQTAGSNRTYPWEFYCGA